MCSRVVFTHVRMLVWWVCCLILLILPLLGPAQEKPIDVRTSFYWYAQSGSASSTDPLIQLMKRRPDIRINNWSGLTMPGDVGGRTPLMLAIAGQSAPDLYYCWFHIIRQDISQGFIYPLNEWIGVDKNGDGQVSPTEARWPGWKDIDPLWRQVVTVKGNIYGLPVATPMTMGLVFRTDLVRQAGLNPNYPPQTWDEFFYWCQRLTFPKKMFKGSTGKQGQCALALATYSWRWLPWVQSAGGSPIVQERVSPATGKTYTFPMEEISFITPDGENLRNVPSRWKAIFHSAAALTTTAFYHKLRWQRWVRDPQTNEPVNLSVAEAAQGWVNWPVTKDGIRNGVTRRVTFRKDDVITGVVRMLRGQPGDDEVQWLSRGEVAMLQGSIDDLSTYTGQGFNPNLLSAMAIPQGPDLRGQGPSGEVGPPHRVVQLQRHFVVMTEGVGRRSKRERDAVWEVLKAKTSQASLMESVKGRVYSGNAHFVDPQQLIDAGFPDYVDEVPPALATLFADIRGGRVVTRTEPFSGYWLTMDMAINQNVLSLMLADNSSAESVNYVKGLRDVELSANTGVMFERPKSELAKYRSLATAIFILVAALVLFFVGMIIKTTFINVTKKTGVGDVHRIWLPWLLLLPALVSIALWGYYPLIRGMQMAFQNYHIVGKSEAVGLDNFINIFLNPDFYIYVSKTLKFVFLNMLFAFPMPIILALMLSEIPRGKIFLRTVFFLPQLTSGLVITLLWKLMYNASENGILNKLLALLHYAPKDWLGDPQIAMMATIVPGIWAGMGMSSLIYLAALKGIPTELYEAAGMDGANFWAKIRYITIPQLMPLIIINFVGAFIGTFQGMGNIFLLTFGGPGKETMVLSMAIWLEAFNNLRFSMATALAWILGSALIGFTYMQIRFLSKVEFRRAEEV